MGSSQSTTFIPLEIQLQIDACCLTFEQQWKEGRHPKLDEFVTMVEAGSRTTLLRELLAIELCYRTDDAGRSLTNSQICELYPNLMPDILQHLQELRNFAAASNDDRHAGLHGPATRCDPESTEDHQPQRRPSRGLHIRCPHCSNAVELVSDTPYENIICRTCGSAFSLVDADGHTAQAPTLQKLGRFEIVSRVGIGGFGTVWKARDTELDRVVAIKIPRKGQLDRQEVEQFVREARTAAQLRHANIVPVHEVGREGETVFIVSDLIRGVSLSDWLSGDQPSYKAIAELMAAVAGALHYAHQNGVIHRDIKPSNILIDEHGQPFVMDFGLAKRETGEITMTIDGQILGTPAYMSPEQARGESSWIDCRTDIYSFGVVLFRLLTGELPFRGNAQMQVHQRLTKDPPDPRALNHVIPSDLSVICLKCLEPDPNRRYSGAKEVADELARFLRGEPILSRPISSIERALRWAKRKPMMATTGGLILFLAIAGPLAALFIEKQRHRLQELLAEKNNLIDRWKGETQLAAAKNTELSRRLDVWEGRANPWDFWPPRRDESPRGKLVLDVLDHSRVLFSSLQAGKYDREMTARGYLGLALLAEAQELTSDARQYFELALNELATLRRATPMESRYARALAECYDRLARLNVKDREQAMIDLQKATGIYGELAAQHTSEPIYQIDWLESEVRTAILAGSETGQAAHLSRAEEISRALKSKWPNHPDEIYQLACFLTQNEAILCEPSKPKPQSVPQVNDRLPKD